MLSKAKIKNRSEINDGRFKWAGIYRNGSKHDNIIQHGVTDLNPISGARSSACGLIGRFTPDWIDWREYSPKEGSCKDCADILFEGKHQL